MIKYNHRSLCYERITKRKMDRHSTRDCGIAASIFILYMSFPKLSDYIEKYLNYEPAEAVVIEEYNDGQLLIEYVVNNKPYQEEISDGRTRIPRTVNIKYNPQNPSDIINSLDTTIIIIIAFIFTSAILGIHFFLKSLGIERTENVEYINGIKVTPMKLWQQMLLCFIFFLIGMSYYPMQQMDLKRSI